MPEFTPRPAGADGHPPAPAASPVASSRAHGDGAAAERADDGLSPAPSAPAPESAPPALGAPGLSSPSTHPQREEDSPDLSPAGAGSEPCASVPAGTTPLAGKAFRDAVKAEQSAQAKARRNGRGRYPVKRRGDGYKPGMTRRLPPPGGAA